MNALQEKLNRLKIKNKVILFYTLLLLFALSVNFAIFSYINKKTVENQLENSSTQLLEAINHNLKLTLDSLEQFVGLTFYDPVIQETLLTTSSDNPDVARRNIIIRSLTNMLFYNDFISSVIVYDNKGNVYSNYGGKNGVFYTNDMKDGLEKASWYDEVIKLNGKGLWIKGSGGVLKRSPLNGKTEEYISLIKIINRVDTFDKIAIVIVTMDISTLRKSCMDISVSNGTNFIIADGNGQEIVALDENGYASLADTIGGMLNASDGVRTLKINGAETIVVNDYSGINDWRIFGFIPFNQKTDILSNNSKAYLIIAVLSIIMILLGAFFISSAIIHPITRMEKYMMMAENGNFVQVPYDNRKQDEISHLKKVFNQMIVSINNLITQIKEEEKIIRRNEFELIQSQVNPHFLYNTLDAISSLSLLGDCKNTYTITKALGDFYRISLSGGKDLVTVREEIECIKNYITILNIRYDNRIICEYEIDKDIIDCLILKLILQPIVENAVHHGIRKKTGAGRVKIIGYAEGDDLIFIVSDDGVGMPEEKIREILGGTWVKEHKSFGLYSSVQRISNYYGMKEPVYITSTPDRGTEVIIRIKGLSKEGLQ